VRIIPVVAMVLRLWATVAVALIHPGASIALVAGVSLHGAPVLHCARVALAVAGYLQRTRSILTSVSRIMMNSGDR
jgi:hypothetical protein